MAIFRCNKCGHVREVGTDYIGKSVACPKCSNNVSIYETTAFVNALIKKHIAQTKELNSLRSDLSKDSTATDATNSPPIDDVDIHNTNIFTKEDSFTPIIHWFEDKNIRATISPDAMDTTGFFDEIALQLGDNFGLLSFVSNQIRYIQNKGYTSVKLDLAKKSSEESRQIAAFCQSLYDYSFVAKYYHQKKDKILRLTLQTAPKIREFFNGIWMEWFTLMKLLQFFQEMKISPSCARGVEISFSGDSKNELDLFFLTATGVPVCIECKSGEFRHDINKYLALRKQLKMEKSQFILCVFGLSQQQAQGMTSMYDLTFVNETSLIEHIRTVV